MPVFCFQVSVSCGIPDFRSRDGIYARLAVDFPDLPDPQAMFDIEYFKRDPRPFFKFAKVCILPIILFSSLLDFKLTLFFPFIVGNLPWTVSAITVSQIYCYAG